MFLSSCPGTWPKIVEKSRRGLWPPAAEKKSEMSVALGKCPTNHHSSDGGTLGWRHLKSRPSLGNMLRRRQCFIDMIQIDTSMTANLSRQMHYTKSELLEASSPETCTSLSWSSSSSSSSTTTTTTTATTTTTTTTTAAAAATTTTTTTATTTTHLTSFVTWFGAQALAENETRSPSWPKKTPAPSLPR